MDENDIEAVRVMVRMMPTATVAVIMVTCGDDEDDAGSDSSFSQPHL